MMTKLFLFMIVLSIHAIACYFYYRKQNQGARIGGPISKPKILWLGLVLFLYFIMPLWLIYFTKSDQPIFSTLLLFILLIYMRFIFQTIFMFIIKKWTPAIGITYNLICFLIVATHLLYSGAIRYSILDSTILNYLLIICACLLTDSYYAWRFYQIVGSATKGKEAVWYASENDSRFSKINQLTSQLNVLFYALFISLIFMLFYEA